MPPHLEEHMLANPTDKPVSVAAMAAFCNWALRTFRMLSRVVEATTYVKAIAEMIVRITSRRMNPRRRERGLRTVPKSG